MSDPEAEFREWAAGARVRLRRTAYLLCGDWHLAEDLTQETLVRIYSVWHRVARSGPPDAYATTTLVNTYRSLLRRPWRRELVVEAVPEPVDGTPRPAEPYSDTLMTALAQLGMSQRTVVVLRYWEDRSVQEVAALLGLSTGTVKSQAARGLRRLRQLLGEQTGQPADGDPDPSDPPTQPRPSLTGVPVLMNGELS